ncbi:hypothetical protein LOTGIDRAFT_105659 [Lottia gigantea]|uniref:Sulfatase N-terminal domain-containing protein n=1 Tax=Lottia gigantea TaxID=225164 RepID=V4BRA1_LOTGI|nr:hypothetical protein LOTGIDRAFT_105659 [Lottia gigantea]ESO91374.1 hypothetical protein LOTGIDRAFT_105659 [Lottia gigantea]
MNLHPDSNSNRKSVSEPDLKCIHPELDPNHPDLIKFFFKIPPLKCAAEENWVYIVNGTFYINKASSDANGDITCDIYPMVRKGDFDTDYGEAIKDVKNGTALNSDFIRVDCKANKDDNNYSNVHCGIAYQKELHERKIDLPPNALNMDFLMVGFDSISRMTSIRKLPKTRDYFLNTLGGFELFDYNILGDGTPAALLPILTGQTEEELPEARRGHANAKTVDGHPWIWNDFKKAGYVTTYAEDSPGVGTFHYRMKGWEKQPTDHYMRNFFIAADKTSKKDYCFGSKPKHIYFLDWLRDTFVMYRGRKKWTFGFHGEISHDDSNKIDYIDEDIRKFFEYLQNNSHLENTLLIFMSDHGARFSKNREAAQGKQEERMPMFFIRFPPWFEKKYPDAMKAFKINTHRLATPFDIHETLKDLLNFTGTGKGDLSKRGISLFKEIPKERTCQHAAVEVHWCACLDWKAVSPSDPLLKRALQTIVTKLNKLTEPHRSLCAVLSIKEVKSALKFITNSKVLAFKKAKDHDGRIGDFSANTKDSEILYQITVVTEPNNGHYEITIKHIVKTDEMTLSEKDISRTNMYGHDPDCIAADFPYLRPICYCKK